MNSTLFIIGQLVVSLFVLNQDWKKDKTVKENLKLKAPFLILMILIAIVILIYTNTN